jgi:hypothetical protein
VAAIGAEELDLLVAEFLVVTIKLAFALRAGHPKNFRHDSSQRKKIRNPNIEIRNKPEKMLANSAGRIPRNLLHTNLFLSQFVIPACF